MSPLFSRRAVRTVLIAACGTLLATLTAWERPYGAVSGTLLTAESGAALSSIPVSLVRGDGSAPYHAVTGPGGRFAFRRVAAGSYRLLATTRAHEQPKQTIAVREGETTSAVVELRPKEPFLDVVRTGTLFLPGEAAKIRCMGFVPQSDLSVRLYRVAAETAIKKWHGRLTDALTLGGGDLGRALLDSVPELRPAGSRAFRVTARDLEGMFREEIPLGTLSPGMYLAAVEAGPVRGTGVVTVTDLALVAKSAPDETLVYASDLASGAPRPGVRVDLARDGASLGSGTTGPDGMVRLPALRARAKPAGETGAGPAQNAGGTADESGADASGDGSDSDGLGPVLVVGRSRDSLAVAELEGRGDASAARLRVYSYTDRPVYRPGQRVFLKAMARDLAGEAYRVPPPTAARVRITDGDGDLIHAADRRTNGYGSLADAFTLPDAAIPGSYTAAVSMRGRAFTATFQVQEYRKPEFQVDVTPERKRYSAGETVRATIGARYYYGAPVPNAAVTYTVTRSPSWYAPDLAEWDDDAADETRRRSADSAGGEVIESGTARLDGDGRLEIAVPPKRGAAGEDESVTIDATVTDAGRRSEDGSTSVPVTQGDFRIDLSLDAWVAAPGKPATAAIRAVDFSGHPVSGARGDAVFERVRWRDGSERTEEIARRSWSTLADGTASVTFTPDRDGDYRIVTTTADRAGRPVTASADLWAMGEDAATFDFPYQDLDVRADRRLYKEGEAAQIVVNTRYAPQTALMTVEGARLIDRRVIRLAARSTRLTVPIGPELLPAARVSVAFFRDKRFVSGEAILNVSRERKALKVDVTPDRATYRPGDRATYRVRTRTPDGRPIAAEVSFGLVDEAIYAIEPESAPNIVSFFYPRRIDGVRTASSFPDVYLSGDEKSSGETRTRRDFQDTAFWRSAVVTGADGTAAVTMTLPDNLTTWRATCRAASLDTQVGQAVSKVTVSKPFSVRLEAPRFFTRGDEARIAAVAHNLTGESVRATVAVRAPGAEIVDAPSSDVTVPAGGTQRVEWRVRFPRAGPVAIRVSANAPHDSDAMELTLPVQPDGRQRTEMRSGVIEGRTEWVIPARRNRIPGTAALEIRVAPSMASALLASLDELAAYPYGCVEQTVSSFVPDLAIGGILDRLGGRDAALKRRLPSMVRAGLLKLYRLQKPDGAWGWWEDDPADPWMTAYAVSGLLRAKAAGYPVTRDALDRGMKALKEAIADAKKADPDTVAYGALILAEGGDTASSAAAVEKLMRAPTGAPAKAAPTDWGRAMLAAALARTGREAEGRAVLDALWSRYSAGALGPEEGGAWRSRAEVYAALLSVGLAVTPADARIARLAGDLLALRRGAGWDSTRDTAFAVDALGGYLLRSDELRPDSTVRITVNGRTETRRFTPDDLFRPPASIRLDGAAVPAGPLSIAIEKSGAGRVYYAATLTQRVSEDLTAPLRGDSGLTIERRYRRLEPGESPAATGEPGMPGGARATFASGDVVEVTLIVRARRPVDFVMIEDSLPAGFEADPTDADSAGDYGWATEIVRDRTVGFAVRRLEPGARRIAYRVVTSAPGLYNALPPAVFDMYDPAARGEGVAHTVEVRP